MQMQDYRYFLLDEYGARKARNKRCSLRAFARDIGMPSAQNGRARRIKLHAVTGEDAADSKAILTQLKDSGPVPATDGVAISLFCEKA